MGVPLLAPEQELPSMTKLRCVLLLGYNLTCVFALLFLILYLTAVWKEPIALR